MSLPIISLRGGAHKRVQSGYPWVFSNEIDMTPAAKNLMPGSLVQLARADRTLIGVGHFNPHSLIAIRMLDRNPEAMINADWFRQKLHQSLTIRDQLFVDPCYRLCHAEADFLPGLVIDRFGDVLTIQTNSAGMTGQLDDICAALVDLLQPRALILRNDSPIRHLEGLMDDVRLMFGTDPGSVALTENNCQFRVNLLDGQKTGWFYDHRDNRAFMARLARDKNVLDLYCYAGAFTIPAARAGAQKVVALDRSAPALELAQQSAVLNDVAGRCDFVKADVFDWLEREKSVFDVVIADPPAFIKSRKDAGAGLKGYQKLSRLAAKRVAPGGYLMVASCSHHAEPARFMEAVMHGVAEAGCMPRILRVSGAGPDHPTHPMLPESGYLKAIVMAL